ncbi:hypothetical protein Pyn_17479 [Prunus yedoensis var. nudiflora]|uniref:Uncharacterized protein n=1 Tax=Prunus yedoensis var. nudiflora TaxID=2094558 RepID=A0A314YN05_PRUYE|nr:hypothetical protein Pyn_17479 [Prunus yedoensis var. nudiflora]
MEINRLGVYLRVVWEDSGKISLENISVSLLLKPSSTLRISLDSSLSSHLLSLLNKSITVHCRRHRARRHRRSRRLRFNVRSHLEPLAVVVIELAAIGGQHLQGMDFSVHLRVLLS